MSPLLRIPPSVMIGLLAALAHQRKAASCQPPVPKPVLSLVMQTLPGRCDFGGVSASIFEFPNAFWGANVTGDDKRVREIFLDVLDHVDDDLRMAMRDIDGDVFRIQLVAGKFFDKGEFFGFDANRNRREQAFAVHIRDKICRRSGLKRCIT